MYLSFHPYIEPRRECTKLVVENERHESFATIDRMFFFLLQLTEVAEVRGNNRNLVPTVSERRNQSSVFISDPRRGK